MYIGGPKKGNVHLCTPMYTYKWVDRPIFKDITGKSGMDADEMVVEDSLSLFGLHRLHVIRLGDQVDVEKWMNERVKGKEGVTLVWLYEEKELGIQHLRLYWKDVQNEG